MDDNEASFRLLAEHTTQAADRIKAALAEEPHYDPLALTFTFLSFAASALINTRDQFATYADMEKWFLEKAKSSLTESDHADALQGHRPI